MLLKNTNIILSQFCRICLIPYFLHWTVPRMWNVSTYKYSAYVKYNIKGSQPCTVLCYFSQIQYKSIWNMCVLCYSKRAAFFVDSFRLFIWGQLLYIYIMIQNVMAGGRVLNNLIQHNNFLFRYILQSKKNALCVDHVLFVSVAIYC